MRHGACGAERPATDGWAGVPAHVVSSHEWQREPTTPRTVEAMAALMAKPSVRRVMPETRHAPIAAAPTPFPRMKRSCTHRARWRPLSPRSVT